MWTAGTSYPRLGLGQTGHNTVAGLSVPTSAQKCHGTSITRAKKAEKAASTTTTKGQTGASVKGPADDWGAHSHSHAPPPPTPALSLHLPPALRERCLLHCYPPQTPQSSNQTIWSPACLGRTQAPNQTRPGLHSRVSRA